METRLTSLKRCQKWLKSKLEIIAGISNAAFEPVIGGNNIWLLNVVIKARSTTFLFINSFTYLNEQFLILFNFITFKVQSVKQMLSCIPQMIRVQVSWTKMYSYISLLELHTCQTSGQWLTTKTVHLPLNTQENVRGMRRLLSWLGCCRRTFQLIWVQHKQQTEKSIFPDSTSKNKTYFNPPPLHFFLKLALFLLIFCTVRVCTVKFLHVTSCKGQATRGVKEYTGHVSIYFPH